MDDDRVYPYCLPDGSVDRRYWVRFKPYKTYGMRMAAQRASRVFIGSGQSARVEFDDEKATYALWEAMIVDGLLPDPDQPGAALPLIPANYPKISDFFGQRLDDEIARRDGADRGALTVTIAGSEADFRGATDAAGTGEVVASVPPGGGGPGEPV